MTLLSYLIPNLSGGVAFSGLSFLNLRGLVGLTFHVRLVAESLGPDRREPAGGRCDGGTRAQDGNDTQGCRRVLDRDEVREHRDKVGQLWPSKTNV